MVNGDYRDAIAMPAGFDPKPMFFFIYGIGQKSGHNPPVGVAIQSHWLRHPVAQSAVRYSASKLTLSQCHYSQLLQALYYKSDAELFTNEAAGIGAKARKFTLEQNARLFAALDSALADARIAAWQSKYDLVFWRPITAINADAAGAATTYDWKPLGTTPSHPSSTGGHSSTVSAGAEILRAFFHSDSIVPGNTPVTLTGLPWLVGTNNGTGKLLSPVDGQDGTFRKVSTLTQLQLENGRSRIYLGVHYGNDDFQGQSLGLSVADAILEDQKDPAVKGVAIYPGNRNVATARNLRDLLVNNSDVSGFFGLDEEDREGKDEDKDDHSH